MVLTNGVEAPLTQWLHIWPQQRGWLIDCWFLAVNFITLSSAPPSFYNNWLYTIDWSTTMKVDQELFLSTKVLRHHSIAIVLRWSMARPIPPADDQEGSSWKSWKKGLIRHPNPNANRCESTTYYRQNGWTNDIEGNTERPYWLGNSNCYDTSNTGSNSLLFSWYVETLRPMWI